ncbi:MAG: aromatic ring-hydroxylating dioxygenase subunit alpha [Sphingomonas sp.]
MDTEIFRDFARLWVALCPASTARGDRPTALTLAGERIVLFRDRDGVASALLDRCPHRGVALSLGRIIEGQIACPFHGWQFDGAGRCLHVPWNPDAKRETLSAIALPVRESGGLIWLYTGRQAEGTPAVPDSFLRADLRVTSQEFLWDAHWTRVMENMLDTPHLPFVHARTIGRRLRGLTNEPMEMMWRETEHGAEITARRGGEETGAKLRFHFPNLMELEIDPGGRTLRLVAVCNPAASGRTRLTIYTLRNFARSRLFDPLFARANARIAAEDRAIVESSLPAEVPPPGEERSVATDAPTLAFRKIWLARIKGS